MKPETHPDKFSTQALPLFSPVDRAKELST